MRPSDAAQHVADGGVPGVEAVAGVPVGARDRRDLAAQGGAGVALAEVGQVVADQGRAGRHGREAVGGAPLGEVPPVGL